MNKAKLLVLAGTLSLGPFLVTSLSHAQSQPIAAGAAAGEITGKVMVVNVEKRLMTIRKPDGEFQVIHVPDEVRRLDEIKINDELTITYMAPSPST